MLLGMRGTLLAVLLFGACSGPNTTVSFGTHGSRERLRFAESGDHAMKVLHARPLRGGRSCGMLLDMRGVLLAILMFGACSGPDATIAPAGEQRPPNFVVVLADDLGYADVGFHGLRDFATPNIDRLAAEGVRFTNAYVSHPYCSPSRAGLLTGRYQHRFGHVRNPKFRAGEGLPLSETLLPEVLSDAGYVSGIVGKWHLGDAPPFHPKERGFDEFFGLLGGGHDYFQSAGPDAREYLIPLEAHGEQIPVEGYLTEQLTAAALDFIRRNAGHPFFLYLSYNAPHGPLQAPPELLERVNSIGDSRRQTYAAMVTSLDDGVGEVLALLEELGMSEGTLVFFLSDNGGPTPANASDNAPLRATKGTVYEGGVRVPFVMAWPSQLPAGNSYDPPVSSLDIFPTVVAAAGLETPADLDGVNLMPYLAGTESSPPHEQLFWHSDEGGQFATRTAEHKLVRVLDREPELYAIGEDISESNPLNQDSGRSRALDGAIKAWHAAHPHPAWPGTRGERPVHPNTVKGLGADQAEVDAWAARQGK